LLVVFSIGRASHELAIVSVSCLIMAA